MHQPSAKVSDETIAHFLNRYERVMEADINHIASLHLLLLISLIPRTLPLEPIKVQSLE
jgi:hypothetical protein